MLVEELLCAVRFVEKEKKFFSNLEPKNFHSDILDFQISYFDVEGQCLSGKIINCSGSFCLSTAIFPPPGLGQISQQFYYIIFSHLQQQQLPAEIFDGAYYLL